MRLWSNGSIERGSGGFNPEKRLLAAVLQRAITDYLTCDGELRESAHEWLYGPEETGDNFCFSYICEALDFHRDELRKAIRKQFEAMGISEVVNAAVANSVPVLDRIEIEAANIETEHFVPYSDYSLSDYSGRNFDPQMSATN